MSLRRWGWDDPDTVRPAARRFADAVWALLDAFCRTGTRSW